MAAEIIHDDDVAGFEEWNELLFDIGAEAFAVDWAVSKTQGAAILTFGPEVAARTVVGRCPYHQRARGRSLSGNVAVVEMNFV